LENHSYITVTCTPAVYLVSYPSPSNHLSRWLGVDEGNGYETTSIVLFLIRNSQHICQFTGADRRKITICHSFPMAHPVFFLLLSCDSDRGRVMQGESSCANVTTPCHAENGIIALGETPCRRHQKYKFQSFKNIFGTQGSTPDKLIRA